MGGEGRGHGASTLISLLGPVEVTTAAGSQPVVGQRLQALLAVLPLAAPRSVSDDQLIDDIWGDRPPVKPVNALQAQVSQLRRVLGGPLVAREGAGYRLRLAADAVDAHELERLVQAGRDAAARSDHGSAGRCHGLALGLVRGRILEGLDDLPAARQARVRLEELLLDAHEGSVDAALASGRHADVVDELVALVHDHPLRERFHAQLMLALYRAGRQADALRAYQAARRVLGEEMGLEPGPELRALEQAVLSHDPALAAPIPLVSARHQVRPPRPRTSFVGRSAELVALDQVTAQHRLVTVLGAGGVGKTRLVLEWAAQVPERERWFVDSAPLAPHAGPAVVAEAVAAAVGAPDRAPRGAEVTPPAEERIVDRLASRPVTIILDNCEHVLDGAAPLVEHLLDGCPELIVVATSRAPLGVAGEQQVALGPLGEEEAVALFRARATSVDAGFVERGDAVSDIAGLCRRLDGLPLAIELAAARAKALSVTEITARLDDRFELLTGGPRPAPDRQQGLRAAMDWSYDLLAEEEAWLLRRLSVFAGGASLAAVEEVHGPGAVDALGRLVDQSLLVVDTSAGPTRFAMLESLRAYGRERLDRAGERDAAEAAHRTWCIRLAEEAEVGVRGLDQLSWLDDLDREHDNLVAALARAVSVAPEAALRLIGALALPWWFRGRGREARSWADACLAAWTTGTSQVVAAKALTWSGLLADFGSSAAADGLADFDHELHFGEERQRQALVLARGDPLVLAYAEVQLSLTLTRRRLGGAAVDVVEIDELIAAALERFVALGDEFGMGITRTVEAVLRLSSGDADAALVAVGAARTHALTCGDRFVQGRAAWIEGLLARARGELDVAYQHVERGLRLLDELGMGPEVSAQAGYLIELGEQRADEELAAQWRRFVAGQSGGLARHDRLVEAAVRKLEAD